MLLTAILQKIIGAVFTGMHQIHSRGDYSLPSHEGLARKFVIINIERTHELAP